MSIPILMYHQISTVPAGTVFPRLHVAPINFARQMACLARWGYRGMSMPDLHPYLCGDRQGKVVGLTFDDGYLDNFVEALPVLQRHGFTATCYGVSALVGGTNLWDLPIGIPQVPLMDASHWRAWADAGQDIGAHTHTHARLLHTTPDRVYEELVRNRSTLEQLSGRAVRHFCYPYGEFDDIHADMVREAGFATATTTRRGRCRVHSDLWRLPRIAVTHRTGIAAFALKLATPFEDRPKLFRSRRRVESAPL